MMNIVKFKIQLSSKDFQPKLPEWPKGRIFKLTRKSSGRLHYHRLLVIDGTLSSVCAMQRISVNEIISGHILGRLTLRIYFITLHVEVIQYTDNAIINI